MRPESPARIHTEPARPTTKPVAVPKPERTYSSEAQPMAIAARRPAARSRRKASPAHDPKALPPAVAALLAVTAIPPPRPNQFRRKPSDRRRISIDELVNEWKSDDVLNPSFSSSPALSVLLEDLDGVEVQPQSIPDSVGSGGILHTRSTSAESVPSLEADDRSVLSVCAPSTPGSLRSKKSSGNFKRERGRSMVTSEDSSLDHPLVPAPAVDPDDDLMLSTTNSRSSTPKPKASLKSNLTTSLLALKKAAITSISAFGSSNTSASAQRPSSFAFSDEMLWAHPFLFPRFSPEVRPDIKGTPTKAERRYLNPLPLTFEEQEAPFQRALHAPYLAEPVEEVPTIQMQTYSRGKRKTNPKCAAGPTPSSEAGRVLLSNAGVRQREPRENSDFLRVVVLEMNMRREGKLESGRAKIWLPPRQESCAPERSERVPERWVGVSAY